jgi:hypothetical protein
MQLGVLGHEDAEQLQKRQATHSATYPYGSVDRGWRRGDDVPVPHGPHELAALESG